MRLFNGERERKKMQVTKQGESDQSLDIEYWFLSCLFTLHSWGSSHSQKHWLAAAGMLLRLSCGSRLPSGIA